MFKFSEEEMRKFEEEARLAEEQKKAEQAAELDKDIEDHKNVLSLLDKIKETAAKFDGKVINVRFERAINALSEGDGYGLGSWIHIKIDGVAWKEKKNIIIERRMMGGIQTILYASGCVDGKRLNFEKFSESVNKWKESFTERVAKMEADKDDGYERICKYNKLVEELETIEKTFSESWKRIHNYEFNSVIYKVR